MEAVVVYEAAVDHETLDDPAQLREGGGEIVEERGVVAGIGYRTVVSIVFKGSDR
jgi:hypothetical protein